MSYCNFHSEIPVSQRVGITKKFTQKVRIYKKYQSGQNSKIDKFSNTVTKFTHFSLFLA